MTTSRPPVNTIHNRLFWTDFFLLYESLPALWDMRNPLYKEKSAKLVAYDTLVDKLREVEPNADREDVLRKINIFRTNYRRECSRINMSIMMGKEYKTTLWYFDLLNFLQTQDVRKERKPKRHDSEKSILRKRNSMMINTSPSPTKMHIIETTSYVQDESLGYDVDEDVVFDYISEQEQQQYENTQSAVIPAVGKGGSQEFQNEFKTFNINRIVNEKSTPTQMNIYLKQNEDDDIVTLINDTDSPESIIEHESVSEFQWYKKTESVKGETSLPHGSPNSIISRRIQRQAPNDVNTEYARKLGIINVMSTTSEAADILAKSWAIQYDELIPEQKVYARKAIADILFEGCLGNLGRCGITTSSGITIHRQSQVIPNAQVQVEDVQVKPQDRMQTAHEQNDVDNGYVYEEAPDVKINDWMVGNY